MKASRVKLAARMAAIEAFREERERQQLAAARRVATEAADSVVAAEQVLHDIQTERLDALAVRNDVGRYLMWGDLAEQAARVHDRATDASVVAEAAAAVRSDAWATAKVRADATDDRAMRIARDEFSTVESVQQADRMDLWLSRRGHKA